MKDINTWYGTGRLGHDPELRYTPKELAVTTFSIAVDRGQDADKNEKGTDWIDCIAFGKTAEAVKRIAGKGCWIYVSGPLTVNTYDSRETDENGNPKKKRAVKINVREWRLLKGGAEDKADEPVAGFKTADEDIPF